MHFETFTDLPHILYYLRLVYKASLQINVESFAQNWLPKSWILFQCHTIPTPCCTSWHLNCTHARASNLFLFANRNIKPAFARVVLCDGSRLSLTRGSPPPVCVRQRTRIVNKSNSLELSQTNHLWLSAMPKQSTVPMWCWKIGFVTLKIRPISSMERQVIGKTQCFLCH